MNEIEINLNGQINKYVNVFYSKGNGNQQSLIKMIIYMKSYYHLKYI